jgi:hypothetical protein
MLSQARTFVVPVINYIVLYILGRRSNACAKRLVKSTTPGFWMSAPGKSLQKKRCMRHLGREGPQIAAIQLETGVSSNRRDTCRLDFRRLTLARLRSAGMANCPEIRIR